MHRQFISRSKTNPGSFCYTIPPNLIPTRESLDRNYFSESEINKQSILKYIEYNYPEIKWGDIVHFTNYDKKENEGKLLWDGTKLHFLDYTYDEYGHVPSKFRLGNIQEKKFFAKTISHNNYVWYDLSQYRIVSTCRKTIGDVAWHIHKLSNNGDICYIISTVDKKHLANVIRIGIYATEFSECNVKDLGITGDNYLFDFWGSNI